MATRAPSTDERSFFRHARNYVSASVITGVLRFASVAVITRLMSPAEYGIYSIFLAAIGVLTIVFELNFRGAVNRYYLEQAPDFRDFLRTVVVFLGGFNLALVAVLTLLRRPLSAFFEVAPDVFLFAIACSALQVPWNLQWKLLVAEQKSGAYARLSAIKDTVMLVVGSVGVMIVAYRTTGSLADPGEAVLGRHLGLIGGTFVVSLLFAGVLTRSLLRQSAGGRFDWRHARYALAFGVPLIAHSMSNQVLSFFDRIVINQVADARAVGLYTFAYNLGMAMGAVVTAMNQAWLPVFIELRRTEDHAHIRALARRYTKMIVAVALLICFFARELGTLMADSRYYEALPIVPVVVFGYVMIFVYTIYANHSFFLNRTWLISIATVIAGVVNVVLNYALVPVYGYGAAAWTTLASYVLLAGMHFAIARFALRERVVPLADVLPSLVVASLVAAAFTWAEAQVRNPWLAFFALKLPLAAAAGAYGWKLRQASPKEAA